MELNGKVGAQHEIKSCANSAAAHEFMASVDSFFFFFPKNVPSCIMIDDSLFTLKAFAAGAFFF